MSSEDAPAPVKKSRSEAQIQALDKARAEALELRTQRNVLREKHNISDETPTDDAETENAETESSSASETESEEPKASVVEKKEKPVKKESKPKTEPAPKPKPQSKPQQREEHVPIPQNFRMMSRNQYILFEE